jgi:hypothetical protein
MTTPRVTTELKRRRKLSAHFIETVVRCEHPCRKRQTKQRGGLGLAPRNGSRCFSPPGPSWRPIRPLPLFYIAHIDFDQRALMPTAATNRAEKYLQKLGIVLCRSVGFIISGPQFGFFWQLRSFWRYWNTSYRAGGPFCPDKISRAMTFRRFPPPSSSQSHSRCLVVPTG